MISFAKIGILFLLFAVYVDGKTFYVDSESLDADIDPGDGICRTANWKCSLRAAIDESNARSDMDKIVLPAGTFRTNVGESTNGLVIRERVSIVGKDSFSTVLSGDRKERHFAVVNEKLFFGLPGGRIGALRPSSGRRLPLVTSQSNVATAGEILFLGEYMFVADFIGGVHKFSRRTREEIEASSNKDTFSYDKLVIDGDSGNGAGLTTPTALATTKNGDLLVNSFQPNDYDIRRYDSTFFSYKGTFIRPPGIVNSMVTYKNRVYVTLVSDNLVSAYDADNGAFLFSGGSFLHTPRDIKVCNGRIFVVSEKNHVVVEFDENLKYQAIIVSDPTRMKDPQGLACFANGDVFIKTKRQLLLHYKFGEKSSTFYRNLSDVATGDYVAGLAAVNNLDYIGRPGVSISKLTLKDGKTFPGGYGPSVAVSRGCWTKLSSCHVQNNHGSVFGGAITNFGTMVIEKCRIFSNTMPRYSLNGRGIVNAGGAIANIGKMTIQNSEISNNTASRGGGIFVSGSEAHLTVHQSTISGNFAGNAGGGIYNARYTEVTYSTITQNECGKYRSDPRKHWAGCGFYSYRSLVGRNYKFSISSSIIAGNKQLGNLDTYAPDCLAETSDSVQSYGGNIIGGVDESKCKLYHRTDWDMVGSRRSEIDPKLGALKELRVNGKIGMTQGHEPWWNSPAVSFNPFGTSGNPKFKCPAQDQVGRKRPQNVVCDVGAIERGR